MLRKGHDRRNPASTGQRRLKGRRMTPPAVPARFRHRGTGRRVGGPSDRRGWRTSAAQRAAGAGRPEGEFILWSGRADRHGPAVFPAAARRALRGPHTTVAAVMMGLLAVLSALCWSRPACVRRLRAATAGDAQTLAFFRHVAATPLPEYELRDARPALRTGAGRDDYNDSVAVQAASSAVRVRLMRLATPLWMLALLLAGRRGHRGGRDRSHRFWEGPRRSSPPLTSRRNPRSRTSCRSATDHAAAPRGAAARSDRIASKSRGLRESWTSAMRQRGSPSISGPVRSAWPTSTIGQARARPGGFGRGQVADVGL